MIEPGSVVLAGFSGGADSTAMMLTLCSLKNVLDIKLIAVHVNHGIRKEAEEDEAFVRSFCKEHDIECFFYQKDIPKLSKKWKMTEEEAGRRARYEAFFETAKKNGASVIAVAHHQNDVAETLLMNLLRGSGLHGAGAIRPVRGNIIRPFLCVNRDEIEKYLRHKRQLFCHDKTNDENIHTRNIVRNILIPRMEKDVNKNAVAHLCRAAIEFAKADGYIQSEADEVYKAVVHEKKGLVKIELKDFRDKDDAIKSAIILRCLESLTPSRKDITSAHVDSILAIAAETAGTASIDLPYNLEAVRSYDSLTIGTKDTKSSLNAEKEFEIPSNLEVGDELKIDIPNLGIAHIKVLQYNGGKLFPSAKYTKWFDYDRIQRAIIRPRKPDDYILLEQGESLHKKKIGKLMTDEKVPKAVRDEIYLLTDGSNVLWVPGIRMSGAYKINDTTGRILEINIDNGGFYNG
ncbi:tRNA lysidine(34) synthetase TilS [Butyrivibrio sp. VCB2006]|uniref:tRNA lysidine(34) synthetase TilS n=1 Tax=Butyrivibrio sp. VCB2006 TaxID=1280679 RepID=UPI0004262570|nr:tRNA lysidine(34) synthetase TilS [Butyrivibrio sp. VCB2006]